MEQFIKIKLQQKFSQNDARWKNSLLGSQGTIGAYGCTMTDITMAYDYFFQANETPLTINKKILDGGGYQVNLIKWFDVAKILGLTFSGKFANSNNLTVDNMNQIKKTLDKGFPVLLQIDTVPATSAKDEHWILAIGYDGDDFIIQDPWDGATKRITSWGVTPQKLIYEWCWYEGKVPAITTPEPTVTMTVKEADAVRLRRDELFNLYDPLDKAGYGTVQKVNDIIEGHKSRTTKVEGERDKALSEKAVAEQKETNAKNDLANKLSEWQQRENSLSAQIDELKKTNPNLEKVKSEYETQLAVERESKDKATKKMNEALIANSKLLAENDKLSKQTLDKFTLWELWTLGLKKIIPFLKKTKLK